MQAMNVTIDDNKPRTVMTQDDPPVSTTKIAPGTITGFQIESLMDCADREAAALGLSREEYLEKMGWRRIGGLWLAPPTKA